MGQPERLLLRAGPKYRPVSHGESFRQAEDLFRGEKADDKLADISAELAGLNQRDKLPIWVWACIAPVGLLVIAIFVYLVVMILCRA